MKILHVYKDYFPILGGIENHIKTLAEAQQAAGHQVTVLVTNPNGLADHFTTLESVELIRAGRLATVASTPVSLRFPFHLRRQSPDITHLHFPYPLGELSQLWVGRGRPYVFTYHSDVINPRQQLVLRFYKPFLKRVLAGAQRILATSANYIASSSYLKPLSGKCEVVPLGIDPKRFQSTQRLLPPADQPTLLFLGRHRYYKGLEVLLRAIPDLQARLLVGGDGPKRPQWERLASELALTDRVTFLGDVADDDLPGLYASADCFVLPATQRAEAFGIVLLEAMASGLPCVTTELGTGTSFVVQDRVTGYVVPPDDPNALAQALSKLLKVADIRQSMGAAGRERVLREFTAEKMVQEVEAVYRRALGLVGAPVEAAVPMG